MVQSLIFSIVLTVHSLTLENVFERRAREKKKGMHDGALPPTSPPNPLPPPPPSVVALRGGPPWSCGVEYVVRQPSYGIFGRRPKLLGYDCTLLHLAPWCRARCSQGRRKVQRRFNAAARSGSHHDYVTCIGLGAITPRCTRIAQRILNQQPFFQFPSP